MIPHSWVTSMIATGIEPREMVYNELINHLVNLESTVAASSPEEPHQGAKKKKFDKSSKKGEHQKIRKMSAGARISRTKKLSTL